MAVWELPGNNEAGGWERAPAGLNYQTDIDGKEGPCGKWLMTQCTIWGVRLSVINSQHEGSELGDTGFITDWVNTYRMPAASLHFFYPTLSAQPHVAGETSFVLTK